MLGIFDVEFAFLLCARAVSRELFCPFRLHCMQASASPTIVASITFGYYPSISTRVVMIRGDAIAAFPFVH